MPAALIRKLDHWSPLDAEDRAALAALATAGRSVARGEPLIVRGAVPTGVFLLLDGWAMRSKLLRDGSRQIVGLLLPGDLCDIHGFLLDRMDHDITMVSAGRIVAIPRPVMLALIDSRPRIARALLWGTLVDEATLREWLVNLGGRDALARTAHLLCELQMRLSHVGLATAAGYALPLTQVDLADALGLTPVHVNRVLRRLREQGCATVRDQRIEIADLAALRAVAEFDPHYMHERRAADGAR